MNQIIGAFRCFGGAQENYCNTSASKGNTYARDEHDTASTNNANLSASRYWESGWQTEVISKCQCVTKSQGNCQKVEARCWCEWSY